MRLTLYDKEISSMMNALDFYGRMWIGQYKEILFQLQWYVDLPIDEDLEKDAEALLSLIRPYMYPELDTNLNVSHGIYNPKVADTAGLSYNILQVLRYKTAYAKHPGGGTTVEFSTPFATGKEPLPECTVTKDADEKLTAELTLSEKYANIVRKALQMKQCFENLDILGIFQMCTNNADALKYAEKTTALCKQLEPINNAEEKDMTEKLLEKINAAT